MTRFARLVVAIAVLSLALVVWNPPLAQGIGVGGIGFPAVTPAGVSIDAQGHVNVRQADTANELAGQRLRAKALSGAPKGQGMAYVSLPKVLAELKERSGQKKPLSDELRFLSGITQLRYVFVYTDERDLVIAGPAEPIDAKTGTGTLTGRPLLQLEDLIVALRAGTVRRGQQGGAFGCSIDPTPDAMEKTNRIMQEMSRATRGARMNAMKEAIGPQKVTLFGLPEGTVDTRFAFVAVAADYKLKRMCLGLDPVPVPGVGSPVDNTRAASNRFWFEADYAPLLVSPDGDAFEIRGPRLVLKSGAFTFDPKGGTDTARTFAKNFSAKMPQLATVVPVYAELQNVSDLALLAALIRQDGLAEKGGVDMKWVLEAENYKVATLPTPRTAETLVNYTNGSIVAGGVSLDLSSVVTEGNRERDRKSTVSAVKGRPSGDNWWKMTGEDAKPSGTK